VGKIALAFLLMLMPLSGFAMAQESVRIAYIDTLSGGGASVAGGIHLR